MHRFTRTTLALLAVAAAALAGCDNQKPKATKAPDVPVVEVGQPVSDYVVNHEDFTGRTDAEFTINVRARVTGYLDKVYFKDGEEVKEGDVLFEIDPRPYEADLARMESSVAQNVAHLNRLEADFGRAKNLYARGNIGREEFDKIAGDRAEAEAAVGVAKAGRDLAKLNVVWTKIKAPISGRLSRRLIDPGNLIKSDDTDLTTIVSLDPMFVYFEIDERTLLGLRRLIREGKMPSRQEGATLKVQIGLSDEADFAHEGTINYSDNKVDPNTGTLQVRAVIPNPKPRVLSPGLFTRVRLPIGDPHRAVLVPEDVLASDQGKKYVYVVENVKERTDKKGKPVKEGTVRRRDVTVGSRHVVTKGGTEKTMRVIESGLAPGDLFAVSGLQRIKPGIEVQINEPKAPEPAKAKVETKEAAGKQVARD